MGFLADLFGFSKKDEDDDYQSYGGLPAGSLQQQEDANMDTLAKAEANYDALTAAGYSFHRGVGYTKPGAPTIPESEVNLADTRGIHDAIDQANGPPGGGDQYGGRDPYQGYR